MIYVSNIVVKDKKTVGMIMVPDGTTLDDIYEVVSKFVGAVEEITINATLTDDAGKEVCLKLSPKPHAKWTHKAVPFDDNSITPDELRSNDS